MIWGSRVGVFHEGTRSQMPHIKFHRAELNFQNLMGLSFWHDDPHDDNLAAERVMVGKEAHHVRSVKHKGAGPRAQTQP